MYTSIRKADKQDDNGNMGAFPRGHPTTDRDSSIYRQKSGHEPQNGVETKQD